MEGGAKDAGMKGKVEIGVGRQESEHRTRKCRETPQGWEV